MSRPMAGGRDEPGSLRVIAAARRVQSFPDGFRFAGAMNAAFRQIGNAVPPLLALALARTLHRQLMTTVMTLAVAAGRKAA